MENGGYIYILTNPSFKEYVKIGYADNVKQRLRQLNRSAAVPFAFRVYALYKVSQRLQDKKLHSIIDKLKPKLRSIENIGGKLRTKEFYAMTPEEAYDILEAIADINDCRNKLTKIEPTFEERKDEEIAQELAQREYKNFYDMGLKNGDEIFWKKYPECKGVISGSNLLNYNGEDYTPTGLLRLWQKQKNDTLSRATYRELKYNDNYSNLRDRWMKMHDIVKKG